MQDPTCGWLTNLVQLDTAANTVHWPMGICKPNLIKHNYVAI